jgi:hypothetical protein
MHDTVPRGLDAAVTSAAAKRKRKPCLSTNQRLRQVRMWSPCENIHPAFSGWCQNSTWSAVSTKAVTITVWARWKKSMAWAK